MKSDAQHFSYEDLKNIDELVDSLKDLVYFTAMKMLVGSLAISMQDVKRLKSYDDLEAETIKSSVIRRKLETCPQQFAIEIQGMGVHKWYDKAILVDFV